MILNSYFISPFYILVQYLRSDDESIETKMEGKEKQTVRFNFQISKGGITKFGFNLLLNLLNSSLFFFIISNVSSGSESDDNMRKRETQTNIQSYKIIIIIKKRLAAVSVGTTLYE